MKSVFKNIILLGSLILAQFNYGQELLPMFHDSTLFEHQIVVEGNGFSHATSLQNAITRKFLFGGEISEEWAQRNLDVHDDYNRIGGGYNLRVQYRNGKPVFKNNENWSWMINAANEAHLNGQYTGDLFGLVFLGNEQYLGKTADLDPISAQFLQFWSIGGGFHDRKTKSFVTLNAILPQNYFQMGLGNSSILFSSGGESVRIKADGEVYLGNPDIYFKGIGAAVNFDFNFPFGDSTTFNGVISLQARNIGFYRIHKATRYNIDINETFNGFALNDIIGGNDFPSLADTLELTTDKESRYKMLPGFVQVAKIVSSNSKHRFQPFFGVRMYTNKIYRPLVFGGVHFQADEQFSLGAQLSYGGYGALRLGMYLNYNADNFVVGLGTEDLLGLILNKQFGNSALIRMAWKL